MLTNALPGSYSLVANKVGGFPIAYVNAADALKAALFYGDSLMYNLSQLQRMAADVNGDGAINAADALQILLRYVGKLTSFARGEWIFSPTATTVSIGNQNVPDDVVGLTVGDVNGDAVPNGGSFFAKANGAPSVIAHAGQALRINGSDAFEVPVRVATATNFGSISLAFQYPADAASFVGVRGPEGMVSAANDGVVAIAWFNAENALNVKENDAVVTLRFKPSGSLRNFSLTLDPNSQVTDAIGTVLTGISLEVPAVVGAIPTAFAVGQNFPNPFNPSTTIRYELPTATNVSLRIFNALGQLIATLVDEKKEPGYYAVKWSAAGLPSGVYFYRLQAGDASTGSARGFVEMKKMILLK